MSKASSSQLSALGSRLSALELSDLQREVLEAEVPAFAERLGDPASQERYGQLYRAVASGVVSEKHLVGLLETMLELVLQTQRVRRTYGHEADRALAELFWRTPRGAALKAASQEVARALEPLQGQPLQTLGFAATIGGHRLTIETGRYSLAIVVDRNGARVERVDADL